MEFWGNLVGFRAPVGKWKPKKAILGYFRGILISFWQMVAQKGNLGGNVGGF